MKTKTITLYSFDELSKESQEKAHMDWIAHNDYYFLPHGLKERLHEILEEKKIKPCKVGYDDDYNVMYSLSSCQGDGVMFEGRFIWGKYYIVIKHSGRYYHYNSKEISIYHNQGAKDGLLVEDEKVYDKFDALYVSICKELEQYGYSIIEHEDSLESFKEACEANDYTFTSDGKMENE